MYDIKLFSAQTIPSKIVELLLEADPSEENTKDYLQIGELYVAEEAGELLTDFSSI